MSQDVPAGWYPTPDGRQKYWDGTQWTNLPYEGVEPTNPSLEPQKKRGGKRTVLVVVLIGAVLALGVGATAWKVGSDATAAAELAEIEAEQDAAEQAEATAAAAQERDDKAERATRASAIAGIEGSVKAMAEKHATDGAINGPIIDASCSPLGGGSTDDLTEQTTVFDCFVATQDNGDGTMSGYNYEATMNWSSGEYTYGLNRR